MCGIAGIIARDGAQADSQLLNHMVRAIRHRGPDGEGQWFSADGSVGLAQTRLAILDTSEGGHQPMISADGRFVIVYNGEIFNFLELKAELEELGHRFRSTSDTEVILAAWARWQEGMLDRFNGMWAMAIYDCTTRELFLARDRFGVKPLLYSIKDGALYFASELRVLQRAAGVGGAPDLAVAKSLLFDPFSVEGSERTLFTGIRRLPGGHCARWCRGGLAIRRWWRTNEHLVDVPNDAEQQADRFREIFFDAVRLRMRSDVPIGTSLSGGFDSSAIVCAMAEIANQTGDHLREASDWRHAFIASFPGFAHDEIDQAMEVVRYSSVTPHVLQIDDRCSADELDVYLDALDDVYIGIVAAPWKIYRELRRNGIVVSIDGHGADELMGGYLQVGGGAANRIRELYGAAKRSTRVGRELSEMAKSMWMSWQGQNFLRDHRRSAPASLPLASDADRLPRDWGLFNRRQYGMFHGTVLPTILRNFDRASSAHGVEVRMPFLDWRLVTYVMSLPDEAKVGSGYSKLVARRAMAGHMPDSIRLQKRKIGFNSPMPEALNGEVGLLAARMLARPAPAFAEIVDVRALGKRVRGLNETRSWNWTLAGRIWPYVHLNWFLGRA
jgi:asparagine synthase (glutamine-hydrolysing)